MNESIVKDLGAVTAYASAVEGGYTGTYEEFCKLEAGFAEAAAEVKANADKVSADKASAANSASSAAASASNASASASNASASASASASSAKDAAASATEAKKLEAGFAEAATEVIDARTGYDGTAYTTLGTAIRTQVNNLSNDIAHIFGTSSDNIDVFVPEHIQGAFIDKKGNTDPFTKQEYYTDYFSVEENSFLIIQACTYEDRRVAFYDTNKKFIKTLETPTKNTDIDNLAYYGVYVETTGYIRMSLGLNWAKPCIAIKNIDNDSIIGHIHTELLKNREIILNVGKDYEYKTLRSAVDAINTKYLGCKIVINLYDSINIRTEYSDEELLNHNTFPNSYYLGIILPKNTTLIGKGKDITISLNWDGERNKTHNNELSILNLCGDISISNIKFTGTNLRYLIHQDGHSEKTTDMHAFYKNCTFDAKNDTGSCVGVGIGDMSTIDFEDCVFIQDTKNNWLLNGHLDAKNTPAKITATRCDFIGNVNTVMEFGKMSDIFSIESQIVLNDCYTQSPIDMAKGMVDGLNVVYKGSCIGGRPVILNSSLVEENPYKYFRLGCIFALNSTTSTIEKYEPVALGEAGIEPIDGKKFYGIAMETIGAKEIGLVNTRGNIPLAILNLDANIGDFIGVVNNNFVVVSDISTAIGRVIYKNYLTLFN